MHLGIASAADIVSARLKARALAIDLGFDGAGLTMITTAITRVASDIVNNARSGEVVLIPLKHDGQRSLKVLAHDDGNGVKDAVKTMQFGYSIRHQEATNGHSRTTRLPDESDGHNFAKARREEEMLRNFSTKILHAQEDERRRISRELHDDVGQSLTAISIALASLRNSRMAKPEIFSRTIAGTQRVLEEAMEKVHRFARELRPAMLDDLGLLPALRSHLKSFAAYTSLRLTFSADASAEQLDDEQ
jgi:signal transduction histidine kinase